MEEERDWPEKKRSLWWTKYGLQILVWSITIAAAVVGGGKWLYSRASTEDIEKAVSQKVDKEDHAKDLDRVEKRVEKQEKVLGIIHTNVVRIMERQNIQPKKLPSDDDEQ